MDNESVWLGPLRRPVRMVMIGFLTVSSVLSIWLIANQFISDDVIGMHEMVRPSDHPIVSVILFSLAGALISVGIYFSDSIGAIEQRPRGFFDRVSLVIARVTMVLLVGTVCVMFYEVISRYVFSRPTLWANELSLWIGAFVFLFAGQYAMQQRSHIRIYVIYDVMPRWMQKAADVLSLLLLLGFTFSLVWGGYADAKTRFLRMETLGTSWDPPIPGTVKPAILLIMILIALQAISNFISDWNKLPEHHGYNDLDEAEIDNIRRTVVDKNGIS